MFRLLRLEDRIVLDGAALTDLLDEKHAQDMREQQMADADAHDADAHADEAPDAGHDTDDIGIDTDAMLYLDDVAADDSGIHVLVISSEVKDGEALSAAAKDNVIVVKYNPEKTSLDDLSAMIKDALGGEKADSIAFASHYTNTGIMALDGSEAMSSDSLETSADQQEFWKSVGEMVDDGGRIDLLACDVAGKDGGEEFVSQIETLSGKNVAASVDATGNEAYGGDWVLETDNVDVKATYFDAGKIEKFDELLGPLPPVKNVDVVDRVYYYNTALTKFDSVYFKLNPGYTDSTGDTVAVLPTSPNYGWVFTDPDDPNTSTTTPLTYSAALEDGTNLNYPSATWLTFLPASRTFTGTPANGGIAAGDDVVIVLTATDPSGNLSTNTETFTISFRNPVTPTTGLVSLSLTGSPMAEAGGTAVVTATLSTAAPAGGVTVYLNSDGAGATAEATDFTLSSSTIFIAQGLTSGTVTITAQNDADGDPELVVIEIGGVSGTGFQENGYQAVSATIIDDDLATPTVTLGMNPPSVNEQGTAATVTAYLTSPAPAGGITVTLGAAGNFESGDFTLGSTTITIAAGTSSNSVTFTANDDADIDNEAVTLSIASAPGASIGSPAVVNATIIDNDYPSVTLGLSSTTFGEEGGTATLTAYLSQAAPSGATIFLTYTGAAVLNTDYTAATAISIAAGASTGVITLTGKTDTAQEGDESFTITAASATGANVTGATPLTATVIDDDLVTVSLSASTTGFSEEGGSTVITATLNKPSASTVQVNLTFAGTGILGSDYDASANSIVIAAGTTTGIITLTGKTDTIIEGNETAIVSLGTPVGASAGTPNTVTTTILDNDMSTVTLGMNKVSFAEAGGSAVVTAYLSAPAGPGGVTVDLGFAGTATGAGSDYSVSVDPIFIAAGLSSGQSVISAVNDPIVEGDEIVTVNIASLGGPATAGTPNTVSATIVDDDAVYVSLGINNASIAENAGSATVTAYLSKATDHPVTVNLSYGGIATQNSDYTAGTSIVIPTGQLSATATITATSDQTVEGNEAITITTSSIIGASNGTPLLVTTNIIDDEVNPVTLSLTGSPFAENNGTAVVKATIAQPSTSNVVVELGLGGTATLNADYTGSTTITIPAGQTSGIMTLKGVDDTAVEFAETVIVDIVSVSGGATESTAQQVTASITDDEVPVATMGISSTNILEGASATITVTLDKVANAGGVTVQFGVTGTVSGSDYLISPNYVYIAAGAKVGTTALYGVSDTWFEGNESMSIAMSTVSGASKGLPDVVNVTIVDEDTAPTVSINVSPTSVNEGATATVTATLSKLSTVDTTVTLSLGGTATTADYSATPQIVIPKGSLTGTTSIAALTDALVEGTETVIVDIASVINATEAQAPITLSIADATALPKVTLGLSPVTFMENSGSAVVTAYMDNISFAPVTVNLNFTGTALSSGATDYTASATYIVIPANSTSASMTLTGFNDSNTEVAENVVVSMGTVTGASAFAPTSVTATIIDDEGTPYVSLGLSSTTFSETNGTTLVVATLTQPTFQNVTVNMGFSGTASTTDYTYSSSVIVITAGSTTGSISLTGAPDSNNEPDETVLVSLTGVSNASMGAPTFVTASLIDDDDAPTVTLSQSVTTFAETTQAAVVTATLSALTMETVTIQLGLSGTAMAGTDYTASSTVITIDPGKLTGSITLTGKDDLTYEGTESVVVDLVSVTGASESVAQQVTFSLIDNESPPVLTMTKAGYPLVEDGGVEGINFALSAASDLPVTVNLVFSGTAQYGTDYTANTSTVMIPPGVTSGNIVLNSKTDTVYEGDETIVVSIGSVVNASYGGTNQTVTIIEDDGMPSVTLAATAPTFIEGSATPAKITAYLSQASALTTTIDLIFTGTAESTDYTADKTQIVIAAGQTSGAVSLTSVNDTMYEGDETVVVQLGTLSAGVTKGATTEATATLMDNDTVSITLGISPSTMTEGGTGVVTAYLAGQTGETVTLNLLYGGTATTADFTARPTTLVIPPGTNPTGSITLTVADDTVYEGSETVIVSAANASTATATINDDGDLPKASVNFAAATFAEGTVGNTNQAVVTLDKTSYQPVTVTLSYTGGTALSGADYTGMVTTLVISAGSTTGAVTLTAVDDSIYEGTESVIVNISNVSGGTFGTPVQAISTITDNDGQPTVTLGLSTKTIAEGGATSVVTAYLNHPSATDVTVTLVATGGTAEATDYSLSNTLVISAGKMTGSVTLGAVDDCVYEGPETFTVDIQTVTGASDGTGAAFNVTITDNDSKPSVTLSPALSTFMEDGGTAVITAMLSNASELDVTVNLGYSGGTAAATDYSGAATFIMITAGGTTGTITLQGTTDSSYEGNETVVVNITGAVNAVTGATAQSATAVIDDTADYPNVTISVNSPGSFAEDTGTGIVTATLSKPTFETVTVTLGFTGSADASDYNASANVIVITAGQTTGTISLNPIPDSNYEADETVTVNIVTVTGAAMSTGGTTAVATIANDDPMPTITLAMSSTSIAETGGTSLVTATLSAKTNTDVVITLGFTGGTAGASLGSDYGAGALPATITIPAGSTTGSAGVTVSGMHDTRFEGNEGFTVSVAGVTGNAATAGANSIIATIVDDDSVPTVTLGFNQSTVYENAGSGAIASTLTLYLAQPALNDVTVTLAFTGGTAGVNDFNPVLAATTDIKILSGATTATISLTTSDDCIYEGIETLIVDILTVTGNGAEGIPGQASLLVVDNDAEPTVTLGANPVSLTEGGSSVITATLNRASSQNVTVTLAFTADTAEDTDYQTMPMQVVITAGNTTGSVTLNTVDDTVYEGTETVIVEIASVVNASEAVAQSTTITILENEPTPSVTLSYSNPTFAEAGGKTLVVANMTGVSENVVTVGVVFSGGKALPTDYSTPSASTWIYIAAGQTTGSLEVTAVSDVLYEMSEGVVVYIGTITGASAVTGPANAVTATIIDDDALNLPKVTLSLSATTFAEDGSNSSVVTATLTDGVVGYPVTVNLDFSGDALRSGVTDYTASATYIMITAGSASGTITLTGVNDYPAPGLGTVYEGTETVIVSISTSSVNAAPGTTSSVIASVIDDTDKPDVDLRIMSPYASIIEEDGGITYIEAFTGWKSQMPITVDLTFAGTALATEYVASATQIVIPANSTSGYITLTGVPEFDDDGDDTVNVTITAVANGTYGAGVNNVTVTMTDNDSAPVVNLSMTPGSFSEAGGTTLVTASIDHAIGTPVTVTLNFSGTAAGIAGPGTDYLVMSGTNPIIIPAGSTSAGITLWGKDDFKYEGDETVDVSITAIAGASLGTLGTATATITDNDSPPSVTLSWKGGLSTIAENDATGSLAVVATLSAMSDATVTVNLAYAGTAVATDYDAALAATYIVISAGSTNGTVYIDPIDDSLYEGFESVVVSIGSLENATMPTMGATSLTGTITDTEDFPTITLTMTGGGTMAEMEEMGGSAEVILTLSSASATPVTVGLAFTGTASATEYSGAVTSIVIPANATNTVVTLYSNDDLQPEFTETVIVDIFTVSGASEATAQQVTVSINDDDWVNPGVTLSVSKPTFSENSGTTLVIATLDYPTDSAVTVDLFFTGGTAVSTDFTATPTQIVIATGSTTGSLVLKGVLDGLYEGSESVVVDIDTVTGNAAEVGTQQVTAILVDFGSTMPSVTLGVNPGSVDEDGTAPVTSAVTAYLNQPAGVDVTVNLSFSGGTASLVTDYAYSSTSILITAGSSTGSVILTVVDEPAVSVYEGTETVVVGIDSLVNATLGTTYVPKTVTITDEQDIPKVTLSQMVDIFSELSGPNANIITVHLSGESAKPVTVDLSFTGTATKDVDYIVSATSVVIPAGQTSTSLGISPVVGACDDLVAEGTETITVDISAVYGATFSSPAAITSSLEDNEGTPNVTLSILNGCMAETGGTATVVATLSAVSATDVTVTLTSVDGTATWLTDYKPANNDITDQSWDLLIPKGQTSASFQFIPKADNFYEGDEAFSVTLGALVNAVYGATNSVTATILDDDPMPTVDLSLSKVTFAEGNPPALGGSTVVTVTLSAASNVDTTVNLNYTGTAESTDYSSALAGGTGTVTGFVIAAGSTTATITLTSVTDTVYEASMDDITVEIVSLGNATFGAVKLVTATIDDSEDMPKVTLGSDVASCFGEDFGTAVVTAYLSNPSEFPVTVELAFTGGVTGGATFGTDYSVDPGTVIVIGTGSTTGTVTLTALNDDLCEGTETVVVDIVTVAGGAESAGTNQVTLTLIDDPTDAPTVSLVLNNATFMEEGAGNTTELIVTLSKATYEAVTVDLAFTDTTDALYGTDYTSSALNSQVVIPAGSTTASVILTGVSDSVYELNDQLSVMGNEDFVVIIGTVTGGGAVRSSVPNLYTVEPVIDDSADLPTVTLSVSTGTIDEGTATSTTVTATLSNPTEDILEIQMSFTGTAQQGVDYNDGGAFILIDGSTTPATTGTLILTAVDDNTSYEYQESVIVGIGTLTSMIDNSASATAGTPAQATVTITDDEDIPKVTIGFVAPATFAENGETATLSAYIANPSAVNTTVTVNYTGKAVHGTDYSGATSIVISAGQNWGYIDLTGIDDSNYEGPEGITATITAVENGTIDFTGHITNATLEDFGDEPKVSLSVSGSPFGENGGTALVTATLNSTTILPVTVDLAFTGTAGASDYTASKTQIVIPANATTAFITLTGVDDSGYEGPETVVVDIVTVANAAENGVQTVTATITDNDPMPKVSLTLGTTDIAEGGSTSLIATLDRTSYQPVTVTLAYTANATVPTVDNGMAESSDFVAVTTIIVNPGQLTGTAALATVSDSVYEDDEDFMVAIDTVSGGVENGTQIQTATIVDDEVMEIWINDGSVTEGDATDNPWLNLTIDRTPVESEYKVTVDWATADSLLPNAATAGTDYMAFTGTVDLGTAYTAPATVQVKIYSDDIAEGDEIFDVKLSNASVGIMTDPKAIATIIDDDLQLNIFTTGLTVDEEGTVQITSSVLSAVDDSAAADITFTVSVLADQGVLFLDNDSSGTQTAADTVLGDGATFTQADIDAGKLYYRNIGPAVGADADMYEFTATVPSGETDSEIFSIYVNDLNDAPTANGAFINGVTEGTTGIIGSVSSIGDADGDTVTLSLANDYGMFALSATTVDTSSMTPQSVDVVVTGTLDYEYQDKYTLTVNLSDGNGGTSTVTVIVAVSNDADANDYTINALAPLAVSNGNVDYFDAASLFDTTLSAKSYTFTNLGPGMTDLGGGILLIDRTSGAGLGGYGSYTITIDAVFDHFLGTDDAPTTTFTIDYLAALDFDPLLEAVKYLDADGELMLPEDGEVMDVNEVMIARAEAPVYDEAAVYAPAEAQEAPAVDPELADIIALLDQEIIIDPETARV